MMAAEVKTIQVQKGDILPPDWRSVDVQEWIKPHHREDCVDCRRRITPCPRHERK